MSKNMLNDSRVKEVGRKRFGGVPFQFQKDLLSFQKIHVLKGSKFYRARHYKIVCTQPTVDYCDFPSYCLHVSCVSIVQILALTSTRKVTCRSLNPL